jgi:hypothetical protein
MSEAEQILSQLAALTDLVRKGIAPRPVLGPEEARELVGKDSDSAFQRWCKTWKVKACGQGRYARRAILAGLEREVDSGTRKRRKAKPAAAEVEGVNA